MDDRDKRAYDQQLLARAVEEITVPDPTWPVFTSWDRTPDITTLLIWRRNPDTGQFILCDQVQGRTIERGDDEEMP